MRKVVKKELIQIIEQLNKANELIQKQIGVIDAQELVSLLAECQESAVVVGGRIDQDAGEGTQAVHFLEEYCEGLYQLSIVLDNKQKAQEQIQRINNCLSNVIDSIRNDLADTQEVVFLPYKASMWDSLESIWMAARDDENCNAYVIPIPYYDKNPDGSFKEVHYEGDSFSPEIPITDWHSYDISKRKPDVIYFHNPYDEYNHVTSVHPFFYSDNLKKYTDKLVYVPYYVCTNVTRQENCLQKGVAFADEVILQSEDIRKQYADYWQEAYGKDFDVSKFKAIGSPKFDKLIRVMRQGIEIPNQWLEKIDGKRVILYNTHLNSLLKYEQEAIKKIDSVFSFFKKRRDVVLLWRPHPLSKATLKAMRYELYEEYCKLEERFVEEEIGILDVMEDMYPAVYVADAYYGDSSSLVTIFGMTGKPICMQSIRTLDYTLPMQKFEGVCASTDKLYYVNSSYNALMTYDKQAGVFNRLGQIPECGIGKKRTVANIAKWKDCLWMLPFYEKNIYSYDLTTGEWNRFELPGDFFEEKHGMFWAAHQEGRYFYSFSASQYGVLKLDMETGESTFCCDNIEQFEKSIVDKKYQSICRSDCCKVGDKLYAAGMKCGVILEYDMINNTMQIYRVGDLYAHYFSLCHDGKYFWLSTLEGKVFRWDKEHDEMQEIPLGMTITWDSARSVFTSSGYMNGYVWFFAGAGDRNIRIHTQSLQVETVYTFNAPYNLEGVFRVYSHYVDEDKMCFVDADASLIVQIDADLNINKIPLREDINIILEYWGNEKAHHYRDFFKYENEVMNLNMFIEYGVWQKKKIDNKQKELFMMFSADKEGTAGEKIHKKMIEGK